MFSQIPVKLIIYCIIIGAIIAAGVAIHGAIDQGGYDRRVAEESTEFKAQIAKITADHTEELAKAQHEAEHYRKVAVLMQTQKPVVLTKIKEKIINENHNCSTINGFSELLNTSIKRFEY